jgi:hypothetical protein
MMNQNVTHQIDDIKLRMTSKVLIMLLNSIGYNFYLGKEISGREREDDIPEEFPSPSKDRDSVGQVSDDDDIGDDEDSKVSVD